MRKSLASGLQAGFVALMQPSIWESLSQPITPRERYYLQRHIERWERRYGKPYRMPMGQLCGYETIRFYGSNDILNMLLAKATVTALPVVVDDIFLTAEHTLSQLKPEVKTKSKMPWYRHGQRW